MDVTTHGCRSSFRDWAGEVSSFPRKLAEAALVHKVGMMSSLPVVEETLWSMKTIEGAARTVGLDLYGRAGELVALLDSHTGGASRSPLRRRQRSGK
jgi:hypothetical protein